MLSCIVVAHPDIVQLEQDTVLGVEALLMLCCQDSSPGAQATLKVRHGVRMCARLCETALCS